MLRLKIILFFSLIILSGIKAQPFDVSVDTIFLNIHEVVRPGARIDLTHAVKFNDNYYCFFKEQGLYSFKINTRYFLIISDKGKIIKNIEIQYLIHNQNSLKYLGTDGFEMLFNHIVKTSNNISLLQADSIENELGGIDMRDYRKGTSHNGFYPGIYASKDFETKRYIKVESQYIAQTIEYLYNSHDKFIKSIFIEWSPTEPYHQPNLAQQYSDENPAINEHFRRKFTKIEAIITNLTGIEPARENRGNGYLRLIWNLEDGIVVKLYGSETFKWKEEIRMIIYKE